MRTRKIHISQATPTTTPGYTNSNSQTVITSTGAPSTLRPGHTLYHLRCLACRHDYGVAGLDIKDRRCPVCQQGAPGEPLRRQPQGPTLFD